MKAKILYTNGIRTVELFWINHTGTDVYCGPSGSNFKRSYHRSGKLHTTGTGKKKNGTWVAPLQEVKGQFHLMTLSFSNSRTWSKGTFSRLDTTRRKMDAAIFIDSRSIPENETVNVLIGLLEPHNFRSLSTLVSAMADVKQVFVATSVVPWFYALVLWPVNLKAEPNKSLNRIRDAVAPLTG